MWLRRPQRFRVSLLRQESNNMLVYGVSAAAPVDSDVVERRLTVDVEDSDPVTTTFGGDATDLGEVKVERDAEVTLSLVDVDGSGNVSEPATFTFLATDTIPPATPGEFGVTLLRQE
jgi:hypothetical protein